MARAVGTELTDKGIARKKQKLVDIGQAASYEIKESRQYPKIVADGIEQNTGISQGE